MKKEYVKPQAEKLEFNYTENILASNGSSIVVGHGDVGHGLGHGGGCDHQPGHGNPKKPKP